jgi:hypothetical protein
VLFRSPSASRLPSTSEAYGGQTLTRKPMRQGPAGMDWKGLLLDAGQRLEDRWDELRRAARAELGWLGPITILPYRGYGDAGRLWLRGRVLESKGLEKPRVGAGTWAEAAAFSTGAGAAEASSAARACRPDT